MKKRSETLEAKEAKLCELLDKIPLKAKPKGVRPATR